jgi:hypothetical protein
MTEKKWYRFDAGPLSHWGHVTEAQATAYTQMRAKRYPDATHTEVAGEPEDMACSIVNVAVMLEAAGIEVAEPEPLEPECSNLPANYNILSIRDVFDMLTSERLDARLRVEEGKFVIAAEFKHWNHNSGQPFAVFHVPLSDDGVVQRDDYMREIAGYLLRLSRGQSLAAPYLGLKMAPAVG